MDHLSPEFILFLFGGGFLAGFVDSIAGGGGLISLPALMATGISPAAALATNKLQSTFGSFTATINYTRGGQVDPKKLVPAIAMTFVGAATGTLLVQRISPELLSRFIPYLLLVVGLYFLFQTKVRALQFEKILSTKAFALSCGLSIGFYDGFFGPGTGALWAFAFVAFQGMDLVRATGHTKVVNFTSNITALGFYFLGGHVKVTYGLTMAMGQILGARLGSGLAMNWGPKLVRPVLIVVIILIVGNLFNQ